MNTETCYGKNLNAEIYGKTFTRIKSLNGKKDIDVH